MTTITAIRNSIDEDGAYAPELSDRQQRVLTYMLRCWINGFMPQAAEIMRGAKCNTKYEVYVCLASLRRKGYLDEGHGFVLADKALELVLKN